MHIQHIICCVLAEHAQVSTGVSAKNGAGTIRGWPQADNCRDLVKTFVLHPDMTNQRPRLVVHRRHDYPEASKSQRILRETSGTTSHRARFIKLTKDVAHKQQLQTGWCISMHKGVCMRWRARAPTPVLVICMHSARSLGGACPPKI